MKRVTQLSIIALAALLLLSSCYTSRTASGGDPGATMAGAAIGGNVGSLVGGLVGENRHGWHGGYRGSAIGAIVGTLAGAAIGNVATRPKATEQAEPAQVEYHPRRASEGMENLRIRNIRFIDEDRDHVIRSGEHSKVIFEIMNEGRQPVFNIVPVVEETTGMKRIYISPSVLVEEIGPRNGIKYTATVTAGQRIKTGEIVLRVGVADDAGQTYDWQEFAIPTRR